VAIEFVQLKERHVEAIRRFNDRLTRGHAVTPFLMEAAAPKNATTESSSRAYVAEEGDEVRGGFLEIDFSAVVGGNDATVLNCQSPLSEGLIDQKYLMLPAQMFKTMMRRNPYVYVVGMGGLQNPLPRFLKAAGWSVEEVPFFYRVVRAARFLRKMPMLQTSPLKRIAAHAAAFTGMGSLAFAFMHRASIGNLSAYTVSRGEWGPWATPLWEDFRSEVSFSASRDLTSIQQLYSNPREIGPIVVRKGGEVVGWSMALVTQMQGSAHFGDLRVATILDNFAHSEDRAATIARTCRFLADAGADIVIANQSHESWKTAYHQAGFRTGKSNYLFAASPKLASTIGGAPIASGRAYVTRADGDGRINL
jgi:hypothetical protein